MTTLLMVTKLCCDQQRVTKDPGPTQHLYCKAVWFCASLLVEVAQFRSVLAGLCGGSTLPECSVMFFILSAFLFPVTSKRQSQKLPPLVCM